MIKEQKLENVYGFIKFKTPSVVDRLRIISKLNLQSSDLKQDEESKEALKDKFDLSSFADIIEQGAKMITEVDVNVNGEHITSWDDLQYVDECTDLIMQLGTALLQGRQSPEVKAKVSKAKK